MKSSIAKSALLAATLSSTSVLSIAQSVVYSNIDPTRDFNQFHSSANEFGDELTLVGTDRTLFNVSFYYYYNGATPGNITLRLYDNVGAGGAPGAMLGTPSTFPLDVTTSGSREGTFSWNLSGATPAVTVPDTLTWTVQFSNLAAGSTAGLLVYGPPNSGTSPSVFWEFVGGTWQSMGIAGTTGDFAVEVTAVPEPGTLALGALALLTGAGFARYRKLRQ